jgi:heptosyltransferase-2
MPDSGSVVIIQTAFAGDVILVLPLAQYLKAQHPGMTIDIVVAPRSADIVRNHPAFSNVVVFDKNGKERGISGLLALSRSLRTRNYDTAYIPHRSLRSALLAFLARIPRRIGFDRSAGRFLLTEVVRYLPLHEVKRNLSLAGYGGGPLLPRLYPSEADARRVDLFVKENAVSGTCVAIAPGTKWFTKRWLPERFAEVARQCSLKGSTVVLVGGEEDGGLCDLVRSHSGREGVVSAAGHLSLLQSAELIRRCAVLVTNDSAPMHMAGAVGTPVVALFGATVPEFGFAPLGPDDVVLQINDLACRPCSIHGGDACPISTFECMERIPTSAVTAEVDRLISSRRTRPIS